LNNDLAHFFGNDKNQNLPTVLKGLGYETAVAHSYGYSCPFRINLAGVDRVSPDFSLYKVIYVLGFGANPWLFELIQMNRIYKIVFGYSQKLIKKSNEATTIYLQGAF
jgi:hypothetical protein